MPVLLSALTQLALHTALLAGGAAVVLAMRAPRERH